MLKVNLRPRNAIHFVVFFFFLGSKLFLYFILVKRFCFLYFAHFALAGVNRVAGFEEFRIFAANFASMGMYKRRLLFGSFIFTKRLSYLPSLRPTFDLYKGASHFDSKFVATLHSEEELRKRQATYITAVVLWRIYAFACWSSD